MVSPTDVAPDAPLGPPEDSDLADAVLRYLLAARWFAGKGRRAVLGSITALPWLTAVEEWPAVRVEVVEVAYPSSEDSGAEDEQERAARWPRELYQLALSYHRAPEPGLQHAEVGRWVLPELGAVVAYDAAQDPRAARVLLRELLADRTHRHRETEVGFHLRAEGVLTEDLQPTVFRGQQSNTSVMLGDVGMLKLFRRLELGSNLDIEVHDALNRAGTGDVARLYGWIDARWPYGDSTVHADLAMAVELLADAHEGWELALQALEADTGFAAEAERLGRALATIHEALRSALPTGQQPGSAVATLMRQRLAAAIDVAPALEPYADGLAGRFAALAEADLPTQRVHGDFHLGQTLRTGDGWKIIDFEGEPVKTLAERAAPDSIWRDLAGMLRSFDYAAASVPGPKSSRWAADCRAAFLAGYSGGEPLAPQDRAALTAYEADKAVYEVVYETRNRPDWVSIPLAAVAALTDELTDDPTKEH